MGCYPSLEMSPSPQLPVMDVFQASLQDSDLATAETIKTMCGHVHRAALDPLVQQAAQRAEQSWGTGRASTKALANLGLLIDAVPGAGCFWWVKYGLKQVPHEQFKALLAAFPQKRQLLVSPEVVLRAARPAGDCSTFSMLIAAMLESLGVRWELVTVAVDPQDPALYSHVFVRAVYDDGARLTLDGSHGKYPGWEVPRAHQFRRQVWNSDGEPISDQAPPMSTLGAYRMRPGLGDDVGDDSGGTYTDSGSLPGALVMGPTQDTSGSTDSSGAVIPAGYYSPDGGLTVVALPAGSAVAPSGSASTNSAAWAAFATALSKSGMTLAEINAIQPGTVVSANGAILRQATGLAVPVGGVNAALGSSSTTLWLVGGAALVVLVMMMSGNRR
jgi:hypothetical protein